MLPSFSLPPLEFCFGTSPIQAEKSRPDRNAFGSAMLATRAVASAGPTPGISSSRLLVSFDRCQAMIRRSNASIWAFSASNWVPRAATQARRNRPGCQHTKLIRSSMTEGDQQNQNPRGPLIALAAVVAIFVLGLLLFRTLYASRRLEDCLLSGRTNCAPIESPTQ